MHAISSVSFLWRCALSEDWWQPACLETLDSQARAPGYLRKRLRHAIIRLDYSVIESLMTVFLRESFRRVFRLFIFLREECFPTSWSKGLAVISGLFLLGTAGTFILNSTGWDLSWPASVYKAGGANGGWLYARDLPWRRLYDYGEIPTILLLIGSLVVLCGTSWGGFPRITGSRVS